MKFAGTSAGLITLDVWSTLSVNLTLDIMTVSVIVMGMERDFCSVR